MTTRRVCWHHLARGIERPAEVRADYHPVGQAKISEVYLCWPCSEDRRNFVNVRAI